MTAVEAQIRASSSSVRMKESASAPAPPYSSGTIIPRIPISARPATTSLGNRSCRSRSTTPGAIRVSANSRTASRIRVWSSVRSKFMGSAPDRPARKAEVRRGPVPCGAGSGGGRARPPAFQAPPSRPRPAPPGRRAPSRLTGRAGGGPGRNGGDLPAFLPLRLLRLGNRPLGGPLRHSRRRGLAPSFASSSFAAASAASLLAARRGCVHPAVLEVAERHDDLGTRRLRTQELDDPRAQRCQGIPRQRGDALRVEEHHPRQAYTARPPAGRLEHHYEEVALVVERVFSEGELRQALAADGLEKLEVLLASLERLLHRDHPVPEHACLWHGSYSER